MKTRIFAAALLMAGMATPLVAQEVAPPSPADAPPVSQPPAAPDPNAGEPTGAVPPEAGALAPADPSVPANPTAPVGSAANPVVVGGNMTAPPAPPKDYPVCTKTITDSCINRGEAHKSRKR